MRLPSATDEYRPPSGFRSAQKARLLVIPGLTELQLNLTIPVRHSELPTRSITDEPSTQTKHKSLDEREISSLSSGSSPALRSPTLDRVRSIHFTPSPPRFISQISRTNLSPTPIRQSFVADLFGSPQGSSGTQYYGGDAGEDAERLESISKELEVDLDTVKRISQRLGS